MKRRVIAFVDHEIGYRLLDKMISSQAASGIELVAAVTTLENGQLWWPGVADLCERGGIPLHRYRTPFEVICEYSDIDWYFLLSWKHVMPPALISRPKCGTINLHYSLLPDYRGVYPVNWAIMDGRDMTGVTYHLVNEQIDAGPIICQSDTSIYLSDTARTLQLRLDDLAYVLFDEMLNWVSCANILRTMPTNPKHQGTYKSRADFIESNQLDLNQECRAIDFLNLLRGKTFMDGSRNLFAVDPVTGQKVYISISLVPDE